MVGKGGFALNAGEGYHIPFRKSTDQELIQWLVKKVDVEPVDLSIFCLFCEESLFQCVSRDYQLCARSEAGGFLLCGL